MNGGGGKGKEWNGRYASRNFKNKKNKSKCTINSKEQNITKFPKKKISKDVAHRKNQADRDGGSVVYVQSAPYDGFEQVGTRKKVQYSKHRSHQRERSLS